MAIALWKAACILIEFFCPQPGNFSAGVGSEHFASHFSKAGVFEVRPEQGVALYLIHIT
jgi:hypothetical protein